MFSRRPASKWFTDCSVCTPHELVQSFTVRKSADWASDLPWREELTAIRAQILESRQYQVTRQMNLTPLGAVISLLFEDLSVELLNTEYGLFPASEPRAKFGQFMSSFALLAASRMSQTELTNPHLAALNATLLQKLPLSPTEFGAILRSVPDAVKHPVGSLSDALEDRNPVSPRILTRLEARLTRINVSLFYHPSHLLAADDDKHHSRSVGFAQASIDLFSTRTTRRWPTIDDIHTAYGMFLLSRRTRTSGMTADRHFEAQIIDICREVSTLSLPNVIHFDRGYDGSASTETAPRWFGSQKSGVKMVFIEDQTPTKSNQVAISGKTCQCVHAVKFHPITKQGARLSMQIQLAVITGTGKTAYLSFPAAPRHSDVIDPYSIMGLGSWIGVIKDGSSAPCFSRLLKEHIRIFTSGQAKDILWHFARAFAITSRSGGLILKAFAQIRSPSIHQLLAPYSDILTELSIPCLDSVQIVDGPVPIDPEELTQMAAAPQRGITKAHFQSLCRSHHISFLKTANIVALVALLQQHVCNCNIEPGERALKTLVPLIIKTSILQPFKKEPRSFKIGNLNEARVKDRLLDDIAFQTPLRPVLIEYPGLSTSSISEEFWCFDSPDFVLTCQDIITHRPFLVAGEIKSKITTETADNLRIQTIGRSRFSEYEFGSEGFRQRIPSEDHRRQLWWHAWVLNVEHVLIVLAAEITIRGGDDILSYILVKFPRTIRRRSADLLSEILRFSGIHQLRSDLVAGPDHVGEETYSQARRKLCNLPLGWAKEPDIVIQRTLLGMKIRELECTPAACTRLIHRWQDLHNKVKPHGDVESRLKQDWKLDWRMPALSLAVERLLMSQLIQVKKLNFLLQNDPSNFNSLAQYRNRSNRQTMRAFLFAVASEFLSVFRHSAAPSVSAQNEIDSSSGSRTPPKLRTENRIKFARAAPQNEQSFPFWQMFREHVHIQSPSNTQRKCVACLARTTGRCQAPYCAVPFCSKMQCWLKAHDKVFRFGNAVPPI